MAITQDDFQALQPGVNELVRANETKKQEKLKALLGAQALEDNLSKASQFAQDQGMKPGKFSVQASEGGFAVNPENDNLMAMFNLQERQAARDDRDLVKLGERAKDLQPGLSAMSNLESTTAKGSPEGGILTNPNYQVKSAGPVANFLPQWAKNVGEKVGLMPEGSSEEASVIQRLMNADIRQMSGTAVTAYEQGRQNVEKGMSGGGNPNDIKLGIKQMQDALQAAGQNVQASTRPDVVNTFKGQGGSLTLEDFMGKPTGGAPPSETPEQKYLRLKAKYKR